MKNVGWEREDFIFDMVDDAFQNGTLSSIKTASEMVAVIISSDVGRKHMMGESEAREFAYLLTGACFVHKRLIPNEVMDLLYLALKQDRKKNFDIQKVLKAKRIRREHPKVSNREIARQLDVDPKTIRNWIKDGRLTASKVGT